MKKILFISLLLLPLIEGCRNAAPKTSWAVTLDHEKKAPYGLWLAWQTLPKYFPQASRELISRRFRYTSIDNSMQRHKDDSTALLVMAGLNYYVSEEEWTRIKLFARSGNEVFIICSKLDNKIETELHCSKEAGGEEIPLSQFNNGALNKNVLVLLPDTTVRYGFNGRSLSSTFTLAVKGATDTAAIAPADATLKDLTTTSDPAAEEEGNKIGEPEVLGIYTKGAPDFIRYTIGSGHITLHAAPLAFSNYFLLQDSNRTYLNGIWHSFPDNISHIYWNEYYKRSTEGSSMNVLWRYPATRWALIIAIVTLLVYVLLGLKRRQRIIPVVQPLENASVSFVEAIGRLYFNKGNHANLAEKMIQHFLEWVRTYYFLDTTQLGDTFILQLVSKSGRSGEEVKSLVTKIHDVRLGTAVTPEYLHELHRSIQSFYNHQRS